MLEYMESLSVLRVVSYFDFSLNYLPNLVFLLFPMGWETPIFSFHVLLLSIPLTTYLRTTPASGTQTKHIVKQKSKLKRKVHNKIYIIY